MGLLQELSRYLSAKYDDGSLAKENEQLREKYNESFFGLLCKTGTTGFLI